MNFLKTKMSYTSEEQRRYYQKKLLAKYPKSLLIQCEVCGDWFRQVGTHIRQRHNLTARDYRKIYGFDIKRGQLPPDFKKSKAMQAIKCGGAKNLKLGEKFRFRKGDNWLGNYERSEQTKARLKNQFNN